MGNKPGPRWWLKYKSYQHMVDIHNNTINPVIRKRCKCGAKQKPEFKNSDFNSLRPVFLMEEDIKNFNNSKDSKKRNIIKYRWLKKSVFKKSDWPKLHTEVWARDRYDYMGLVHNFPSTSGTRRNSLKSQCKRIWKGKFFKESDFNVRRKIRPDWRKYD